MIKWLQKRFALSRDGARDLLRGSLACAFQNISLMMPVGVLHSLVMFLMNVMDGEPGKGSAIFYGAACALCAGFILLVTWLQYNGTYLSTYRESGVRRIGLAERLRRIPLSFFVHKDLADLTSTVMNDCAVLETSQSHFVAPLIGSLISTTFVAFSLFAVDWRMALAALWVLPVAFAIVTFSARVQEGFSRRSMKARLDCEEGVQEFLEVMKDLRSNNATESYLDGLNKKVRAMERRAVISEFGTAVFVVSASLILKLGLASVALLGSILLTNGTLSVSVFFLFLLAASRLYDPLEVSFQNLAAIISTKSNIERMNEILDCPIQAGTEKLTNQGCDIIFDHVGFAYDDGEEVLNAARAANCEEFALRLPEGWNSRIGENGRRLSGGERQRISIARAFLKDAPIVLLDEATASLDVENETAIQSALSRLIRDKTAIVIAHRMRTVAGVDKIVVLRDGTVAEQGTPDELMRQNGIYARMAALQAEGQKWNLG